MEKLQRNMELTTGILKRGLTQKELAEKTGLNRTTISLITTGRVNATALEKAAIASVLDMEEVDLFKC